MTCFLLVPRVARKHRLVQAPGPGLTVVFLIMQARVAHARACTKQRGLTHTMSIRPYVVMCVLLSTKKRLCSSVFWREYFTLEIWPDCTRYPQPPFWRTPMHPLLKLKGLHMGSQEW